MKFKDYYRILGLGPDASADDIKSAYRKLARQFHPDVNQDKSAHGRFLEIGEAYEALGDPQKRAAYDQLRQAGFKEGQELDAPPPRQQGARAGGARGGAGSGFDGHFTDIDPETFSDFFQSFFGQARGGGQGRARRSAHHERGEDIEHALPITLDEAYRGGTRRLQLQLPEADEHGRVRNATRTLEVKIPAGVADGEKIRLRGQGLPGSSPEYDGDLYLTLRLEPHHLFKVDGREVRLDLPLAPWEAVLGASVSVPTLGGPVTMRIPPGSRGGDKLRLRERGLPGTPPGDQIVVLTIAVPAAPSERERELYRQLAEVSRFAPRELLEGAP